MDISTTGVVDEFEVSPDIQDLMVHPPISAIKPLKSPLLFSIDEHEDEPPVAAMKQIVSSDVQEILEESVRRAVETAERFPDRVYSFVNLGLSQSNAGRLQDAAASFRHALQLDPRDFVALSNLARISVSTGDLQSAVHAFRELRALYPNNPRPLMELAVVAGLEDRLDEAKSLWEAAIELAPDEPLPKLHLAMVLLRMGLQQQRYAIRLLKAAARDDVHSAAVHHALGVAYALTRENSRAIKSFRAALSLAPHMTDAVHGLVEMYQRVGDHESAIRRLNDFLAVVPDDLTAIESIGVSLIKVGQFREARDHLERGLRLAGAANDDYNPTLARILNNLAICYDAMGNTSQSLVAFELSVNSEQIPAIIPLQNLARARLDRRDFDGASKVIDLIKLYHPDSPEGYLLDAQKLQLLDEHDRALEVLIDAIAQDFVIPDTYMTAGAILTDALDRPTYAIELLEGARQRYPDDLGILNNLAYAYLQANEPLKARTYLDRIAIPDLPKHDQNWAITAVATWGLYFIVTGDIDQGREWYRRAEGMAVSLGKSTAARVIRQKMYLEVARRFAKMGDHRRATLEARRGLKLREDGVFARHLDELLQSLATPDESH